MQRRDILIYFFVFAETVLERSTCFGLKYGAIMLKNDEIISTGYVGAPRGRANCTDLGYCTRVQLNIPRGERYELCRSVHAEANAIISASRGDMLGATLFLVGKEAESGELVPNASCCSMCKRLVINAGISRVVVRDTPDTFREIDVAQWIEEDESLEGRKGY